MWSNFDLVDYWEESELIRKATPMVNVRFSQLSEMTGMLGKFKHSMDNINELGRNDSMYWFAIDCALLYFNFIDSFFIERRTS